MASLADFDLFNHALMKGALFLAMDVVYRLGSVMLMIYGSDTGCPGPWRLLLLGAEPD